MNDEVLEPFTWEQVEDPHQWADEAMDRDPRAYPHGLFVQGSPSAFTYGFQWFASPEERTAYLLRAAREIEYADAERVRELRAKLERLGEGPARVGDLRMGDFTYCSVEWIGMFAHLRESDDELGEIYRERFWRFVKGDYGHTEPIPDDRLDDFVTLVRVDEL